MFENVFRGALAALLISLLAPGALPAATLNLSSDVVQRQHQDPGTICVELVTRAGEQVAGTENLLVWDGECASILAETCTASPGHGKDLSGVVQRQRDFTYKGLVLSLTDTDPMPPGELYCCDFLVHANPGDCCRVRVASPGGSDPAGNALSVGAGNPGELCVAGDGRPINDGSVGSVGGGSGFAGGGNAPAGGGVNDVGAAPAGGNPAPVSGNVAAGGGTGNAAPGGGTSGGTGNAAPGGGTGNAAPGGGTGGAPSAAVVADLGADRSDAPSVAPPARVESQPAAPSEPRAAEPKAPSVSKPAARQSADSKPARDPKSAAPRAAATKKPVQTAPDSAAETKDEAPKESPKSASDEPDEATAEAKADEPAEPASAPADESSETAPPAAAADAEKPGPRDVKPAQRAPVMDRNRRMPLDDEDGWFGCQTVAAERSAAAIALALPALLLLLLRRRRRI